MIPDQTAAIGVPLADHAGSTVVAANPWPPLFDPSWRLCQLDPGLENRTEICGPYSYYPYGVYGYRPFGTYHQYRPSPGYVHVPDAKVIRLD